MLSKFYKPQKRNNYEPYIIRPMALIIYTLIIFLINLVIFPGAPNKVIASSINSDNIISLVNKDRIKFGLNELKPNVNLTTAAYAKANDMVQKQYWDHYGPNGETPWDFMKNAGYHYYYAGENLAKGFTTAEGCHTALMNSPTHRENILSPEYADIGIAVIDANLLGEDVVLLVQMFGNPSNSLQTEVNNKSVILGESKYDPTGNIKSIRITYPESDTVIKENKLTIKGVLERLISDADVKGSADVYINENKDGSFTYQGDEWEYILNNVLNQGKTNVSIETINNNNIKLTDQVEFVVDSVAPEIFLDEISIENGSIIITVASNEVDVTINLVYDSNSVSSIVNEMGKYEFKIAYDDESKTYNSVKVVASDVAQNIKELDLTKEVNDEISKNNNSTIVGSIGAINFDTLRGRNTANFVFILFILAIIAIELYYYKQQKLLGVKGHLLSVFFIWWLMLILGFVAGFEGNLTSGAKL